MSDTVTSATDRLLREIQREVREGLRTMALRDEQREASYQTMIQVLTRQMVQTVSEVDARLVSVNERLDRVDEGLVIVNERLDRIEVLLADIARKVDITRGIE